MGPGDGHCKAGDFLPYEGNVPANSRHFRAVFRSRFRDDGGAGYLKQFSSVYVLYRYAQIYLMAGLYSDEPPFLWGNELYKCFNTEKLALLFGEKLNRQSLVKLPYDMERLLVKKPANHFLMSYRGELHHLLMPCGELRQEKVKTDDDSIFEDS